LEESFLTLGDTVTHGLWRLKSFQAAGSRTGGFPLARGLEGAETSTAGRARHEGAEMNASARTRSEVADVLFENTKVSRGTGGV